MDFLLSLMKLAAVIGGTAGAIWLGIYYGSKWIDRMLGVPVIDPRKGISVPMRTPEKEMAHAIYKAWQADERWQRMDLATIAKGVPMAFFWAELAARAAIANGETVPQKQEG